jgi:hypothetical protein
MKRGFEWLILVVSLVVIATICFMTSCESGSGPELESPNKFLFVEQVNTDVVVTVVIPECYQSILTIDDGNKAELFVFIHHDDVVDGVPVSVEQYKLDANKMGAGHHTFRLVLNLTCPLDMQNPYLPFGFEYVEEAELEIADSSLDLDDNPRVLGENPVVSEDPVVINPVDRIVICHVAASGVSKTLQLPQGAVEAHLNNHSGDYLGVCND